MTWSIRPYSRASSADMKRSRSVSCSIFSSGWPVCLMQDAVEPFLDLAELLGVDHDVFGRAFHAGQRLVDHDPRVGQGVALARRRRRPAARRPSRRTGPTQYVATSQVMNCIVS